MHSEPIKHVYAEISAQVTARKQLGNVLPEDFINITVCEICKRFEGVDDAGVTVQVVGAYNEIRVGDFYFRVTDLPKPKKKKKVTSNLTAKQQRNRRKAASRKSRGKK